MNDEKTARMQSLSMFLMLLSILIIISPSARVFVGEVMDAILGPTIGFDGKYPVLTIFLASIIMSAISSGVQHISTDWIKMGKYQHIGREISKKVREAYRRGDIAKVKKLSDLQRELFKDQTVGMSSQMAMNGYVMFFGILVFFWLWLYIYNANQFFSVPWCPKVGLLDRGPILNKGYLWMWLYILSSFPAGFVIRSGLRYFYFKKN